MKKAIKNWFAGILLLGGFVSLMANLSGCTYAVHRMPLLPDENNFIGRDVWSKNSIKMTNGIGTAHAMYIQPLNYLIDIQPLTHLKIIEIRKQSEAGTGNALETYAYIDNIIKFQDDKGNVFTYKTFTSTFYSRLSVGIPKATADLESFLNNNFMFDNPYEKYPNWPEQRWKVLKEGRISFEAYYVSNSSWSQEIWDKIENGELWIGASKDMITCILGKPLSASKEVDVSGVHEKNTYFKNGKQMELYFDDDKLVKFKELPGDKNVILR